jgi:hypothetical protein
MTQEGVEEGEIWECGVRMARVRGNNSMWAFFFFRMISTYY